MLQGLVNGQAAYTSKWLFVGNGWQGIIHLYYRAGGSAEEGKQVIEAVGCSSALPVNLVPSSIFMAMLLIMVSY